MNWPLFAIACWLLAVLQTGLDPLWTLGGRSSAGVQLLLIVAAFVPLCTSRLWEAVLAACLAGLLADLLVEPVPGVPLMGPLAIGFAAGACVIWLFKKSALAPSVLSLAFATFMAGLAANAVALVLLHARGIALPMAPAEPVPGLALPHDMLRRLIGVVVTTAVSLPLGFLLMLSQPLWGMGGKQVERRFGNAE